MRMMTSAIVLLAALVASDVSAQVQGVDLNGRWRCVAQCLGAPGSFGFITQNGWELNLVNDAGQASRGWVDYPGRIWILQANQGAIYSPDGLRIQSTVGRSGSERRWRPRPDADSSGATPSVLEPGAVQTRHGRSAG